MDRIAHIDVLDSLGFDNPSAMVVAAKGAEKIASLTDAARAETRWKLGMVYEFQSREDALIRRGEAVHGGARARVDAAWRSARHMIARRR
jgi:hypothetical protein